jgi:CRP/FNR family cyclic AMP-dependent transcriptional regulator
VDVKQRRDALAQTPFFGGLEERVLDEIVALLKVRTFRANEVIVREDDPGTSMFIIESGSVVVTHGAVRMCHFRAGDFFGEMALIDIQPRSMTVLAESQATLLELSNMDLLQLYESDPASYAMMMQNITRELSRRLRRANEKIVASAAAAQDETTQLPHHK